MSTDTLKPKGITVFPFKVLPKYDVGDKAAYRDEFGAYTKVGEITEEQQQDGVTLYVINGGGAYMADELRPIMEYKYGGTVLGENITIHGYETKNFDIAPLAVHEFQQAIEKCSKADLTWLAKCAEELDKLFGIEKDIPSDKEDISKLIGNIVVSTSYFNYATELSVNLYLIIPHHIANIVKEMSLVPVSSFAEGGVVDISDAKEYETEYGEHVEGFVSTWNEGSGGQPVIYGIQNDELQNGYYSIIGGVLKDGIVTNPTEAYDGIFDKKTKKQEALKIAKNIAIDEHFGMDIFMEDGGAIASENQINEGDSVTIDYPVYHEKSTTAKTKKVKDYFYSLRKNLNDVGIVQSTTVGTAW